MQRSLEHLKKYPIETLDLTTIRVLQQDLKDEAAALAKIRAECDGEALVIWDTEFKPETDEIDAALVLLRTTIEERTRT